MKELIEQVHGLDEEAQNDFFENVIGGLTLGRVLGLVKHLEDAWDVEAAPSAGNFQPPSQEPEEEEVKDEFDVVITNVGSGRIKVVKVVRVILDISLKEASDLLKQVPVTIKTKIPREEADNLKAQLVDEGAEVELKESGGA